ncbi:MAG TPA: 5-(carboxyamino)imidazole ribonucleotide synthase, partial [Usitatibacteraceae bacterium]|nr:5-(carboxyamino)imidazole ribonucleotide synthase [Usitatibacteraceae bacterium]
IDACRTSQFEQQVRVLCGLPLGDPTPHSPAVMVNLLGDIWGAGEPRWEAVLRHPGAHLHLYGKREARPARKMGHVTVCEATLERALEVAMAIRRDLGIAP